MNVERINERIGGFIAENRGILRDLPAMQTQILELAAAVAAGDHCASHDYKVEFLNPRNGREFVVKSSSRGHPWNYSRIVVSRDGQEFEIHMNLSVRSARDSGVYCVDIGVTTPGVVPRRQEKDWTCLPNINLITFAEAKKLVVYPMLLAHFIGIVHELAPVFLQGLPSQFEAANHFAPALVTLGYCTVNSGEIVAAYPSRGISVNIEANFDDRFSDGSEKFRFGHRSPRTHRLSGFHESLFSVESRSMPVPRPSPLDRRDGRCHGIYLRKCMKIASGHWLTHRSYFRDLRFTRRTLTSQIRTS